MGGQSRTNTAGLSREIKRAGFTGPEIMVADVAVARLISVVRSQRHGGSRRSLRRREVSGLGVIGPINWHVGRGAPHSAALAFQRGLGESRWWYRRGGRWGAVFWQVVSVGIWADGGGKRTRSDVLSRA